MKAIISDSSPIIAFSAIKKISIFQELFGKVYIPKAVQQEIARNADKPGAYEIKSLDWFEVVEVQNKTVVKSINNYVGLGESEAIVLAKELNLPLLCDDKQARSIARKMDGLNIIGTCSLLLIAKEAGLIDDVQTAINDLISVNYRLSQRIIQQTLQKAGEI
jgi:predicted nucleic acid-binding protein